MKSVRFENGDFALSLSRDTEEKEVTLDVEGVEESGHPVQVRGWFSPDEAREIAGYLIEMADKLYPPEGMA